MDVIDQVRLELDHCAARRRVRQHNIRNKLKKQPRRNWVPEVKTETDWYLQTLSLNKEKKIRYKLRGYSLDLYVAMCKLADSYLCTTDETTPNSRNSTYNA